MGQNVWECPGVNCPAGKSFGEIFPGGECPGKCEGESDWRECPGNIREKCPDPRAGL